MRLEYLSSPTATLRQVGAKHGVPYRSIARRASAEGWHKLRQAGGNHAKSIARQLALDRGEEIGRQLGFSTEQLLTAQIRSTKAYLERIDGAMGPDEAPVQDPESLSKLIGAWARVIGVGRQAFGLDKPEQTTSQPQTFVNHATIYQGQSVPSTKQHQHDQVIDVPPDDTDDPTSTPK